MQTVAGRSKPGGLVAFAGCDFRTAVTFVQTGPEGVNRSECQWASRAFACAGIQTAMIAPLYRPFFAVGLGAPKMVVHAPLCGDDEWYGFTWLAASLRSLLPILEREGIETAGTLDRDTLAAHRGQFGRKMVSADVSARGDDRSP